MTRSGEKGSKPPRGWRRIFGVNILVLCLFFVAVEGLSSLVLAFNGVIYRLGLEVAERHHIEYDARLGWVSVPNLSLPNIYGPNISLTTNARGFRNREDFSTAVPDRRLRIICSGDSFTLGYGVGDEDSWCQRLAGLDARLETVNMGQGGYGADQMYLWYERDGVKLDHDVHLFAIVSFDIDRMRSTEFLGVAKPILRARNGELAVENLPVPPPAFVTSQQLWKYLEPFRTTQLIQKIKTRLTGSDVNIGEVGDTELEEVFGLVFDRLIQINANKNSIPVFVFLPTQRDARDERSTIWRRTLHQQAQNRGLYFVDLVEQFRALPAIEIPKLFIQKQVKNYPYSAGHYTAAGGEFIARKVHEAIMSLPRVRERLDAISSDG